MGRLLTAWTLTLTFIIGCKADFNPFYIDDDDDYARVKKVEVPPMQPKGFIGFSPDWKQRRLSEGCTVHNVQISNAETIGTVRTSEKQGCLDACKDAYGCVAAGWRQDDPHCTLMENWRGFNPYRGPKYDNFYLKDCREHVCARKCHCWDGEKGYECTRKPRDEGVAMDILKKSTNNLILASLPNDVEIVTKSWLDEKLMKAGVSRDEVEVIVLRDCGIKELEAGAFSGMRSLLYLNLDDNYIFEIPPGVFDDLTQLEALMLLNNRLSEIPELAFQSLRQLKYLDLSANPFSELHDDVFKNLGELRTLHLQPNFGIIAMTDKVFRNLKNLHALTITGAQDRPPREYPAYDLSLILPMTKLERIDVGASYSPFRFETPRRKFTTTNCHLENCYNECADIRPNYISGAVKYEFYFPLETLTEKIRKQNFVAVMTHLRVGEKFVIPDRAEWRGFTKELLIEGDVFLNAANIRPRRCRIRPIRTDDGRNLFKFVYYGLEIIAEKIHVRPGSMHEGKCGIEWWEEGVPAPVVDDEFLDNVVKCAELLTYSDRRPLAIEAIDFITKYMSGTKRSRTIHLKSIMIKANLPERLNLGSDGPQYVPYISLSVYHKAYQSVASNAKYYLNEYQQMMHVRDRRIVDELLFGMVHNMTDTNVGVSMESVKNDEEVLRMSEEGVKKIRQKYSEQLQKTEEAKVVLLDTIQGEKDSASYAWWEMAFNGALELFSAVKSLDPVSSVMAARDLWNGYNDHKDNIETMNGVASACSNMLKMLKSGEMDVENVQVYLNDIDKASDLMVRLVEWDHIAPEINVALRTAGMADMSGIAEFEFAIQQLAGWGKKLTEEIIMQATLVRRLAEAMAALEARREQSKISRSAYEAVSYGRQSLQDKLAPLKRSLFDERLKLLEMMSQYCQSYIHYYLLDCESAMIPNIQDSLKRLIEKAMHSRGIQSSSLMFSMQQPPQKFHEMISLKDTVTSSPCNSSDLCPVHTFKTMGSVTFNIPLDDPAFVTYDRVRVEEIQIHLPGVTARGSYAVSISTTSLFKDRMKDRNFEFFTIPRFLTYKFNTNTNEVNTFGTVHSEYDDFFSETSPFTDWTVSYKPKYNRGVDFSGVTEIKVVIKGNAISRLAYDYMKRR